jgi:hypothetical protein
MGLPDPESARRIKKYTQHTEKENSCPITRAMLYLPHISHPCGALPYRTYRILIAGGIYAVSWLFWYYAMMYSLVVKTNPVHLSRTDAWPGILMTLSILFIPSWDTAFRSRFSAATAPYRAGNVCSVSTCKTMVGGLLFALGMGGAVLMAGEFIMPVASDGAVATTSRPGWCLLVHVLLMVWVAQQTLDITTIPVGSTATVDTVASEGL